jgi:very-short-patch-repair endonuclease
MAMRGPDRKMIRIARRLRVNQTDAEKVLWNRIRNRQIDGHKFVRQEPIDNYVCDFVCRERLVIIEVDGGQHNESAADAARDLHLIAEGFRVLRFWNNDVLGNLEGVLVMIQAELAN